MRQYILSCPKGFVKGFLSYFSQNFDIFFVQNALFVFFSKNQKYFLAFDFFLLTNAANTDIMIS